ncbi:hypothetical protein [Sulfurimonas indica]|uniref:hypothetical protein n=1 Tax=Sulfurimonas indica TaxID=2508707 RepID=UPI0012647595|nr:hypothetical protein [Sulfurimonas indica]
MSAMPVKEPATHEEEETLSDILSDLRTKCYSKPKKVENIKGTPFYNNCLHLIYGLSKSGKSYSIAQILVDAGMTQEDVIWLDADYNINDELLNYLSNFIHLNTNMQIALDALLDVDGDGKIVVFDSLKDFADGEDLDTNAGAQKTMEFIREFTKAGYTVIVIAHATQYNKKLGGKETKIKGNAETIISKSDIVYFLDNSSESYRNLKLQKTRVSNEHLSDFRLYSIKQVKKAIDKILNDNGELTVRELTNKLSSEARNTFARHKNELIEVDLVGKKKIAKCIQT